MLFPETALRAPRQVKSQDFIDVRTRISNQRGGILTCPAAGHSLPGRDVGCGQAERKLAPFSDHLSPGFVPPQRAESSDRETRLTGETQLQNQLPFHASRRGFGSILFRACNFRTAVPQRILLSKDTQLGPDLSMTVRRTEFFAIGAKSDRQFQG